MNIYLLNSIVETSAAVFVLLLGHKGAYEINRESSRIYSKWWASFGFANGICTYLVRDVSDSLFSKQCIGFQCLIYHLMIAYFVFPLQQIGINLRHEPMEVYRAIVACCIHISFAYVFFFELLNHNFFDQIKYKI